MKTPISVCMIVKNEVELVQKSIPSILPFVEEVVVVDTGSEDGTQEMAQMLGAVVHDFVWQDDFSAARNVSLTLAKQPFIFVLDADEVFSNESEPALHRYIATHQGRVGTVRIQNLTESDTAHQARLPRIFPNRPELRYQRRIHEQLRDHGAPPLLIATDIELSHSGYQKEALQRKNKIERNIRLLELELRSAPEDSYLLYELAKTYYMDKQYPSAATYFQQAVDALRSVGGQAPAFLPSLLLQFGYTLLHLREFSALFQVLETGVDLFPDYTHLYFLYGQALIELKDPSRLDEIRQVFEFCLQKGDNHSDRYESVPGVGSFMAQYNLGVYYEVTGQTERAKELYRRSAAAGYPPAKTRLAAL